VGARSGDVTRRRLLSVAARAAFLAPLAGAALSACGGQESGEGAPGEPAPGKQPTGGAVRPPDVQPAPAPPPQAPPPTGEASTQPVTEIPEMQATVQALQYASRSPRDDQRCSICLFFTPRGGDRGTCQLFAKGQVEAGGWCSSWQAKPTA
jgi:hypothetical protein